MTYLRIVRLGFVTLAGVLLSLSSSSRGAEPLRPVKETLLGVQRVLFDSKRPAGARDHGVESLAREIDWLEGLIETYGTVVPKQPDVWGEARLTKHRFEYEREIAKKFAESEFRESLQGAIRRSDQSFLALSFALSKGTTGGTNPANELLAPAGTIDPKAPANLIGRTPGADFGAFALPSGDGRSTLSLEPTITNDQLSRYLYHLAELRRINEGDDTADSPGYSLNLLRIPVSVLPGHRTRTGYGAEITFTATPHLTNDLLPSTMRSLIIQDVVDQNSLAVAQFLNNDLELSDWWLRVLEKHSNQANRWIEVWDRWLAGVYELQRQNEPGAQSVFLRNLNYVSSQREYLHMRFVEIAYWAAYHRDARRSRQEGTKAECIDGPLAPPASKISIPCPIAYQYEIQDSKSGSLSLIEVEYEQFARWFDELAEIPDTESLGKYFRDLEFYLTQSPTDENDKTRKRKLSRIAVGLSLKKLQERELRAPELPLEISPTAFAAIQGDSGTKLKNGSKPPKDGSKPPKDDAPQPDTATSPPGATSASDSNPIAQALQQFYEKAVDNYRGQVSRVVETASKGQISILTLRRTPLPGAASARHSEPPLSSSEYVPTYGWETFNLIAWSVRERLSGEPANEPLIHVMDIRRLLEQETATAYRLLNSPSCRQLWEHCSSELAYDIRSREFQNVLARRKAFFREVGRYTDDTLTGALAWGIIVEAALLNEKLLEDMRKTAVAKGSGWAPAPGLWFVGPSDLLTDEAHEAFKSYVMLRWPVVVFALDPITQDQNIADVFSRRRELMLAVAVAVSQGKVSPSAAGRFVRRQETDIETIALNRTAVAFSHGNDTFGWRFYPRVQSPETPTTLGAFTETLVGGRSRDKDLRDRQLEPSMRECTAIVITPSFVPHLALDSRANWFGLTNPRKKELTLQDAMRISRMSQAVREAAACADDSHKYRPGDVSQLSRVVDQLDRRAPLQTTLVQIPHENKLGGFQLFETGVTSLGPVLFGYYGAPGIDPDGATTLFLVGDRFSGLETRVIAGGRSVPFRLLSRQTMEVSIPPGVRSLNRPFENVVDLQLATPYGPSCHLAIPMVARPTLTGKFAWATPSCRTSIAGTLSGTTVSFPASPMSSTTELRITVPTTALPTEMDLRLTVFDTTPSGETLLAASAANAIKARLDARSARYVIDGASFDAFSNLLKAAADTWAKSNQPGATQSLQWQVRGAVAPSNSILEPIVGSLLVDMTLTVK